MCCITAQLNYTIISKITPKKIFIPEIRTEIHQSLEQRLPPFLHVGQKTASKNGRNKNVSKKLGRANFTLREILNGNKNNFQKR